VLSALIQGTRRNQRPRNDGFPCVWYKHRILHESIPPIGFELQCLDVYALANSTTKNEIVLMCYDLEISFQLLSQVLCCPVVFHGSAMQLMRVHLNDRSRMHRFAHALYACLSSRFVMAARLCVWLCCGFGVLICCLAPGVITPLHRDLEEQEFQVLFKA
jgi:hypothetical protein